MAVGRARSARKRTRGVAEGAAAGLTHKSPVNGLAELLTLVHCHVIRGMVCLMDQVKLF